jgi:hypothetical protein
VNPITEMPEAWKDLIDGLMLLSKGRTDDISPFHCEHDTLMVLADPEKFTEAELAELDAWGFHPDGDGGFYSYRFGSA